MNVEAEQKGAEAAARGSGHGPRPVKSRQSSAPPGRLSSASHESLRSPDGLRHGRLQERIGAPAGHGGNVLRGRLRSRPRPARAVAATFAPLARSHLILKPVQRSYPVPLCVRVLGVRLRLQQQSPDVVSERRRGQEKPGGSEEALGGRGRESNEQNHLPDTNGRTPSHLWACGSLCGHGQGDRHGTAPFLLPPWRRRRPEDVSKQRLHHIKQLPNADKAGGRRGGVCAGGVPGPML